jgi:protein-S-isoprenylcysteine O-methyltransferase Ste14
VVRHLASLVLPATAAGLVPLAILGELPQAVPAGRALLGGALALGGLGMLAWTVSLFVRIGRGTLAPWDPTRALVIAGPYAYVRNPMICGVQAILLGEAVAAASPGLAAWAAAFLAANHLWFLTTEEPTLRSRFGAEYDAYASQVGRWLPRLTPYRPEERDGVGPA